MISHDHLDPSTHRSFKETLRLQSIKGRPAIIARCLCSRHAQGRSEKNKFLHDEFIDGNIIYETNFTQLMAPSLSEENFWNQTKTAKQRRDIKDFMARDYELWAVNPSNLKHNVIADKSSVIGDHARTNTALEVLLSCDIKEPDTEDATDHNYAYVIAGLYHAGVMVHQDENLAERSVAYLKSYDLATSQVEALKKALDIDIRVFESLITLGLNSNEQDEYGRSIKDVVLFDLTEDIQSAALAVLRTHNCL